MQKEMEGKIIHTITSAEDNFMAAELWDGFCLTFSNGNTVSVQWGKTHYCSPGKTAEVAMWDKAGIWYQYDPDDNSIFPCEGENCVNGDISSDDVAKIISLISAGDFWG